LDVLEKRIRLCNNKTKKEYFPTISDPLLNRPYRGQINYLFILFIFLFSILKAFVKHCMETVRVNKIHGILLTKNYLQFD
jgi:hypothetical protein